MTLISLAQEYADEDKARGLLESLYWPNGPVCPHCKNTGTAAKGVVPLTPKATSKRPGRKGLYFCGSCRKQFSVTVGTVFEGSHIPISKWVMAIFIICSSKKSISANQVHRMLKITYKTAWFMLHRIRFAINHCESFFSLFKRGVYGAWHHISREHLPKYANEFAFRWSTRHDTDGERMGKFASLIGGKRLTYRQAV